jgi:hypothetical protein
MFEVCIGGNAGFSVYSILHPQRKMSCFRQLISCSNWHPFLLLNHEIKFDKSGTVVYWITNNVYQYVASPLLILNTFTFMKFTFLDCHDRIGLELGYQTLGGRLERLV